MKITEKIRKEAEDERSGLRGYCRNCTDSQLQNVYDAEVARAKVKNPEYSAVAQTARVFAEEAQKEMLERARR